MLDGGVVLCGDIFFFVFVESDCLDDLDDFEDYE